MKRFFAALLGILILLSCLPAFAEGSFCARPREEDRDIVGAERGHRPVGEAADTADAEAGTGATENDVGAYRVIVSERNGDPVEGAVIQFCDDTTCAFLPTDAQGIATFGAEEQKVYEVHVLQAPEGYAGTDGIYHTLAAFSDVCIVLEKAEQSGRDQAGNGIQMP